MEEQAQAVQEPKNEEKLDRNSITAFEESELNTIASIIIAHKKPDSGTIKVASKSLKNFIREFGSMFNMPRFIEYQGYVIDIIKLAKEHNVALLEEVKYPFGEYLFETAKRFSLDHI